jgi:hypothetical protein
LKSTEEFKHLAKDIPTEGNQFTFVSQRFGQTVFRIQQQAMAMSASTQPAQQQWLQSLIHSDKQVFSYCVSANTDQGWLTIANGNQHPAKMFLAAAVVPVGVLSAIAIPNFIKARQTSQVNACLNNLRQIDGAKQQWALENGKHASDVPTEADLKVYLGRGTAGVTFPVCPQGGRYTINPVDKNPTCSVHGDILK